MPGISTRDLDHVLEHTSSDVWKALAGERLFVTGGTGFVGKWLLESLLWADKRLDIRISTFVLTRDRDDDAATGHTLEQTQHHGRDGMARPMLRSFKTLCRERRGQHARAR